VRNRITFFSMKKNRLFVVLFFCLLLVCFVAKSQEQIPIYPKAVPNAKTLVSAVPEILSGGMYRRSTVPMMEVYLPEKGKETGTAVIICAGGAYGVIVFQGEGQNTAKELAKNGIVAFVLKYRLPSDEYMSDKSIGPLQDAQQAIKLVRENAAKWGVNPAKIGIMGFSAGGHLASTLATHYKTALIYNPNGTSLRPDFQILVYPVISMQTGLTHADSRRNLLGSSPTQELVDNYSNELQIDATSPPAYLTHSADDATVDVDNSILYFEALRKNKVPVEMHIYPRGGHGFVLRKQGWMEPLLLWMKASSILTPVN
jgi:acetyl esterase/lipase